MSFQRCLCVPSHKFALVFWELASFSFMNWLIRWVFLPLLYCNHDNNCQSISTIWDINLWSDLLSHSQEMILYFLNHIFILYCAVYFPMDMTFCMTFSLGMSHIFNQWAHHWKNWNFFFSFLLFFCFFISFFFFLYVFFLRWVSVFSLHFRLVLSSLVVQAGLKPAAILPSQPPRCWDSMCVPPGQAMNWDFQVTKIKWLPYYLNVFVGNE